MISKIFKCQLSETQKIVTKTTCLSIFSRLNHSGVKGQLNSEWIYEVIVSPKMPTKIFPDFCPERVGQKSGKILVGILGETMTS